MNTSNDKQTLAWPARTSTTMKPSWQVARDISTAVLWKKSARLSLKQETTPNFTTQRSIFKRQSSYAPKSILKPSQTDGTPRMPTEKEATLAAISYNFLCSCCGSSCAGDSIRCRVCIKAYDLQCLTQRGYLSHQLVPLRRHAKQDWSCPDCSDLTRLLSHDELMHLMNAFDQIDRDRDGYIVLEEFLSLKANKTGSDGLESFIQHNQDLGKKYFSLMDPIQQGAVAWSDFIRLYSCKVIAAKDRIELTTKLTEKELVAARSYFLKDPRKSYDNDFNRIITREYFNRIHNNLILILNQKYGIDFIDAILGYDDRPGNITDKSPLMNWSEYLREISLLILLNRANDMTSEGHRAPAPPHLSNAQTVVPSGTNDPSNKFPISRSNTLITSTFPTMSYDESFLKHAKLLQKIQKRHQFEELKRKQMGSNINFTIVENNDDDKGRMNLPKLKVNARDDRRTITDPWTSVKEMQQLRNEPVLIRTTLKF
ncbi:unnamed protein product [Adineta steineri]|uniref:EF-hand domain-containing protein n=1 Tax=Adineta steineri TaxID=433720 RepID=A0A814Z2Z4_9BILA|nr:unnamed protein product [Adineta steineri]CAF1581967.1 unnamed protein product [Adineta steineri]